MLHKCSDSFMTLPDRSEIISTSQDDALDVPNWVSKQSKRYKCRKRKIGGFLFRSVISAILYQISGTLSGRNTPRSSNQTNPSEVPVELGHVYLRFQPKNKILHDDRSRLRAKWFHASVSDANLAGRGPVKTHPISRIWDQPSEVAVEIRYVDSRFQAIWVTVTNRDAILRAKWFHENDTFELKNLISAFENDSNRRPCNTLLWVRCPQ